MILALKNSCAKLTYSDVVYEIYTSEDWAPYVYIEYLNT